MMKLRLILIAVIININNSETLGLTNRTIDSTQKPDFVEITAKHLISNKTDYVSFDISIIEGDKFIEFQMDTTKITDGEFVRECFTIDRESVIEGDLNNDGTMEFAIKCIWSPCEGNMYGIQWYLFLNSGNDWTCIPNSFGGGKFSDVENIKAIESGLLKTEYIKLNEESLKHENSDRIELIYRLVNNNLEKVK